MNPIDSDQFLSDEDLDLANLSWDELIAVWDEWLRAASATDAADAHLYSHGVFISHGIHDAPLVGHFGSPSVGAAEGE